MFEFDTLHLQDDTPQHPSDGDIFITVALGEVQLLRCRYISDVLWTWDACCNWAEIGNDTVQALRKQNDGHLQDGVYTCPECVEAMAQW